MTVSELLAQLEAKGIELWTEGGSLRFRAPKGALTPDLRALLAEQRDAVLAEVRERARQTVETLPVSQSQLSMWLVHEVAPDSAAYNVSSSVRIRSAVDVDTLRRVFQALTDRHAALRTTFVNDEGQPFQRIPGYVDVDFEQTAVPGIDEKALYQRIYTASHQPFDLCTGPVMRVRLFTRAPDDHVLLPVVHHIATDGWSMWILLKEFSALYDAYRTGQSASLPHPEAEYSDFARWQAQMLAGAEGERLWSYWKQQLAGELSPLDLPIDHPRPQVISSQGKTAYFEISATVTNGLKNLAKAEGVTLYVLLLAALQVLLHRYTGQDDIIVGSPTLGRSRPEYAGIVGDFVNMLPMRVNLEGNPTFKTCLAQVQHTVLTALDYQDFPFPLLVERLGPRTHLNRSPVFQVSFDVQRVRQSEAVSDALSHLLIPHASIKRISMSGLEIEAYPLPQQEGQFDLVMQLLDADTTLPGVLKYSSDLYDSATIDRFMRHFEQLLAAIVANPDAPISELQLLTDAERRQILHDWNATDTDYPADTGVHTLFEQQAARTPLATAAVHGADTITYAELNTRANRLAHYLRALDVQPETMIGVHVERGLDMLVALLGVLKAGGAYVPMDPTFPQERLTYMIEDAAMPIIISQARLADQLPPHSARLICIDSDWPQIQLSPTDNPPPRTTGSNLVYVIFTSGSTGRPKGVQIEHHSLTNYLLTMRDRPGLYVDDVLLALATLSFDIAAFDLYLPLIVGARVIILDREDSWDGRKIAAAIDDHHVTVIQSTLPSWQILLESGWHGKRDLKMLCGGEALSASLAGRLLNAGGELWNMYGPTETTVCCTTEPITSTDSTITIGRPIANTTAFILDSHLQPVPVGVIGTLYIGGAGVARGYIGRPDLTAERFIANPFGPGRIYNTGDLARWLPDGRLECLGRVDHQVKVRGFRIELGEIELALETHASVQTAVVTARETQPGDKRLVAYVIGSEGHAPDASTLRDYLSSRLPNYMVPSAVVVLDAFPLTPSGKVDRRALPAPVVSEERAEEIARETRTPAEDLLVRVWQAVLGVEQVSIYDNFFDLGGHSLQVVQVIAKLEKETDIHLDPLLMRYQSLRQQAASIESSALFQSQADPAPAAHSPRAPGRLGMPLFFGCHDELFGMYYPAETASRAGVVICQPWGPEFLRMHRACHQLALRLASAGTPVLRFDYYGTGDSAGDDLDMSLPRSLEDIATAIAELQQRSGVAQVTLVGARLGASLAALAGAQRLVLWEPIVNGHAYLDELKRWQRKNLLSFLGKVSAHGSAQIEILGFALSDSMVSALEALDLLAAETKPAQQALVVERETSEPTRQLCQRLQAQGTAIVYQQIDAPQLWTENVDKALVPQQTLEAIVAWIKQV